MKNSVKHNAGKNLPAQSSESTGKPKKTQGEETQELKNSNSSQKINFPA